MIDYKSLLIEFNSIIRKLNITSTEIGKRLGLSKSTITYYRNGKRKLTLETFVKFCLACEVHPVSVLDDCMSAQGAQRYASTIEDNFMKEYRKQIETLKHLENSTISQSLRINQEASDKEILIDKQSLYLETLQYRYAIYLIQNPEIIIEIETEIKRIIKHYHGYTYESYAKNEIEELKLYIYELTFNDPESLPLKDYLQELKQLICLMQFRHKLQNNHVEMSLLTHFIELKHDSIESFKQINNFKHVLHEQPGNSIFMKELDSLFFGVLPNNTPKKDPLEGIEYEL